MVPLYSPLPSTIPQGALVPSYDLFLPVATSMHEEAKMLQSQRRPAPIPEGSILRFLGVKQTISGLPRDVGADPTDPMGRRWFVDTANRYEEGVTGVAFYQKRRDDGLGTRRVEVRKGERAAHVRIIEDSPEMNVEQAATAGCRGKGDYQSLTVHIAHEAVEKAVARSQAGAAILAGGIRPDILFSLWIAETFFLEGSTADLFREGLVLVDSDRSTIANPVRYKIPHDTDLAEFLKDLDVRGSFLIEAGRDVLLDTLPYTESVPVFTVHESRSGYPDRSGVLHASFTRSKEGPPFPARFVELARRILPDAGPHPFRLPGASVNTRPGVSGKLPR